MEHPLFCYGTLRQPEVQVALFGRTVPTVEDSLPGYRLEWLQITDPEVVLTSGSDLHPILRRGAASDSVDGVRLELSDAELLRADRYEVDDYVRRTAMLASGAWAWVYVAADDTLAELVRQDCTLKDLVEAVRSLPYGRPSHQTVQSMIREGRGTCSTKHLFLARELGRRFPQTAPKIMHRVYTMSSDEARRLFGATAAGVVPVQGLTDVHRYLTAIVAGERITLDVTFPGAPWDGSSPLPLACGPGQDFPAGNRPDAEKRALEQRFCDPLVREPFIHALSVDNTRLCDAS